MNKKQLLSCLISMGLSISYSLAQTIWTGPVTTFTKSDSADWNLAENQDRLTDSVWLTRAHTQSLFNIVSETGYTKFISPANTEWAFGTTAEVDTLTFKDFQTANNSKPSSMIGKDMVLHLISDDIYIDIVFTSFSGGDSGGGFSYDRSTKPNVGLDLQESNINLTLFPNPATDFFILKGIVESQSYHIYNAIGQSIKEGVVTPNTPIDISTTKQGVYQLCLESGQNIRFVKR